MAHKANAAFWLLCSGLAAAALSAVFNGSWAVLLKVPRISRLAVKPQLFALYATTGVGLSSLAFLPLVTNQSPPLFSLLGLCASGCMVVSLLLSFTAVQLVGVSVAQAVWSVGAILTSLLWGSVGPPPLAKPLSSLPLTIVALLLLLIGAVGVLNCEQIARIVGGVHRGELIALITSAQPPKSSDDRWEPKVASHGEAEDQGAQWDADDDEKRQASEQSRSRLLGVLLSLLVGFCGGSVLVPMKFVPSHADGLAFLPAFGSGALLSTLIAGILYYGFQQQRPRIRRESVPYGLAAGVLWNGGNICQIYALSMAGLGYGVAYPMLQCAMLVSGAWGIFALKEIRDPRAIRVYFASSALLVSGAAVLAKFGPM